MLQNLPLTLRRFYKNKLTTSLHIVGLTLGISVCLIIGLFIRFELSFDTYHTKADRIYRVNQVWIENGNKELHYSTPFPLADDIRSMVPGIETVTKVHHRQHAFIEINPMKRFDQEHVMFTDPDFFNVFDVKAVEGNPFEAMRKPYQAILTQSIARKYYGNEDAIGKVFKYNNEYDITVAAIVKDFPVNTHLPAEVMLSFAENNKYIGTNPTSYGFVSGGSTFILLPKGKKADTTLTNNLIGIYDKKVNNTDWIGKNSRNELEVQPMSDIHFNSKYAGGGEWVNAINVSWLWIFGAVGLAVLILAIINFVNLSSAQAMTRAKEIGVRKTIGANKIDLVYQFLTESFSLVFISGFISLLIVKIALPYLNNLTDKKLSFSEILSPSMIGLTVLSLLVTALLAGIYPAWLITKFKPVETLKSGSVNSVSTSPLLRKGLVVMQFTISIVLLIGVLFIGKQVNFMRNKDIGFDKSNIVAINLPNKATVEEKHRFRNELGRVVAVDGVSFSTSLPGTEGHWGTRMGKDQDDPNLKGVTVVLTDEKFIDLYGIHLLTGRKLEPSDTNLVSESIPSNNRIAKSIANEAVVKVMGYESNEAAIGKRFWTGAGGYETEIVGVVADFNVASSREAIQPTLITQLLTETGVTGIKIKPNNDISKSLESIEVIYKTVFPKSIFNYSFLDQKIDDLYKSELRLFGLFKIFSSIAILISCLGLWGLISLTAAQRIKEIGIRKVMGASVPNVVALLTKDFIILVSIAILLAIPLAYFGVHKWLQEFAFRIPMSAWVFLVAGGTAIAIALLTVSAQAIKAAMANPVKSLRSE